MSRVSRVVFGASIEGSFALAMRGVAGGATVVANKTVPSTTIETATLLNQHLIAASISVPDFWASWSDNLLIGMDIDGAIADAVGTAAGTFLQSDSTTTGIGRRMKDFYADVVSLMPKLDQQLPLRIGPLRSQWDTYGPGMLKHIERQIWQTDSPDDWWPATITARMTHPIRGGAGDVCVDGESFWIEALLTNNHPDLPEVLRTVWLATRVAIESHLRRRSGAVGLRRGWSLASVALVLSAAAEVGVTPSPVPIAEAMKHWQFGDAAIAGRVQQWWSGRDATLPMPVLLRQLEA